ncbi:hypothetical protein GQX74_014751 [Glossina fuscipes]|nr:hypothetical protein GQX74_014751 [Glossina fuscipes]
MITNDGYFQCHAHEQCLYVMHKDTIQSDKAQPQTLNARLSSIKCLDDDDHCDGDGDDDDDDDDDGDSQNSIGRQILNCAFDERQQNLTQPAFAYNKATPTLVKIMNTVMLYRFHFTIYSLCMTLRVVNKNSLTACAPDRDSLERGNE